MFKKGQLVKSTVTGCSYVVLEQDGSLIKAYAVTSLCVFNVYAAHMKLIGNNYQAKQK